MSDAEKQLDGPDLPIESSTTEQQERRRPTKFSEYKTGGLDSVGDVIKLIYSTSIAHVVYEVDGPIGHSCACVINRNLSPEGVKLGENFDLIKPKIADLRSVLHKCGDDETIKARRGSIISLGLINPNEAIRQIDILISDINKNYVDNFQKRILYLAGAFSMFILFGLASTLVRIFSINGQIPNKYETLQLILYIMTSGVIGGFISVSYKLKTILFDKAIPAYYFFIYGIERLFISILASIVLFFAIKANIIFGFIKDEPNPFYGYIFLGILAGFSETLIPDLLIKIEKQGVQNKEEPDKLQ